MDTRSILTPVLVAVALTSIGTLPAFAEKNTGAFAKSAEGMRLKECSDLQDQYNFYRIKMNRQPKGSQLHQDARKAANDFLGTAWERGCSWAE